MENQNIKWEPGDIAICVNAGLLPGQLDGEGLPPLRQNLEYLVHAVHQCECGDYRLDVGLYTKSTGGTRCCCGAIAKPGTHIHWANAIRFVKKKSIKAIEEEIAQAVEQEDYELAFELEKQLK